jgi:hypothetical protein
MSKRKEGKISEKDAKKLILEFKSLEALSTLFSKFGPVGFLLVIFTFIFLFYGTTEQKIDFIDTWLLLKPEGSCMPLRMLIFALGFIIIGQFIIFSARLKQTKRHLKEIGKEKTRLQDKLNGRAFVHSNFDNLKN